MFAFTDVGLTSTSVHVQNLAAATSAGFICWRRSVPRDIKETDRWVIAVTDDLVKLCNTPH